MGGGELGSAKGKSCEVNTYSQKNGKAKLTFVDTHESTQ